MRPPQERRRFPATVSDIGTVSQEPPKFSVRAQEPHEAKLIGTSPFFDGAAAIAIEHHKRTRLGVWITNANGVTIYRIGARLNHVKHAGGGR